MSGKPPSRHGLFAHCSGTLICSITPEGLRHGKAEPEHDLVLGKRYIGSAFQEFGKELDKIVAIAVICDVFRERVFVRNACRFFDEDHKGDVKTKNGSHSIKEAGRSQGNYI